MQRAIENGATPPHWEEQDTAHPVHNESAQQAMQDSADPDS